MAGNTTNPKTLFCKFICCLFTLSHRMPPRTSGTNLPMNIFDEQGIRYKGNNSGRKPFLFPKTTSMSDKNGKDITNSIFNGS